MFSDPQFSQIILDAYKLSVAVKVSEELLADNAYDLEGWLINSFSRALANSEEKAMVIGDGISKPTGILTSGEVGITTAGNKIEAADIQAEASVSQQCCIPDCGFYPCCNSQDEGQHRTVSVAACTDCR